MHAPKFNNPVDASFPGHIGKLFLLLQISHAQAKRLHISIEPGNRIEQIVHLQNRQGSALSGLGNIHSHAEQQRPIWTIRENRLMRRIRQQPGRACLADRRGQRPRNGLPRMRLVFRFKRAPQSRQKFGSGMPRHFFQKQYLRRRTCLLFKLPDIPRNPPAPGLLFSGVAPGSGIHRRDRYPGPEHGHFRPMRKRQSSNLQNGFLASPNHRSVNHSRHRFLQFLAVVRERSHKNSASQRLASIAFNQLCHQPPSQVDEPAGNAYQGSIATKKRATHRQNRLDFYVPCRPVTHYTYRESFVLGTAMFTPPGIQTAGSELARDNRFQRTASKPYSKKNNPRNIIQLAGVQSFPPGIKNGDHVVRRNVRIQNNLTQLGRGTGDLIGRSDVMNELSHGSSCHSIRQRSFALNIPATSQFRLGYPSCKPKAYAAPPAGATIQRNHLSHIVGKQQVAREAGW